MLEKAHLEDLMPNHHRRLSPRTLLLALLLLAAAPAHAQYFGQNKVQYRSFDFQVLKTEHFDIYYYPEEREAIDQCARMAERWYARLSKVLVHHFEDRQALVMYSSHPHFEQTNVIEGALGEGTGGVTEALKRRIVLPFAGPLAETDHVLGHELVHAFQYDIGGVGKGDAASPLNQLPLWFIEGMAEYFSLGATDAHTAMWMREAAQREKLPRIKDLDSGKYFPYRYGQAVWAYIAGRWGDNAVTQILKQAGRSGNAIGAIEKVLEIKEEQLSKDWHASLHASLESLAGPTRPAAGETLMATAKPASTFGHALIAGKKGRGDLNVGPALSPDGRYIVFLSAKGLFSIELYLADAKTGEVIRSLTKTSVDPHFESLQFINSAGAWDASSRRFAFAGITKGAPVLTIVDMPSGRILEEVPLKDLDEVFQPTFSPDGKRVAFSAIVGGLTDLYVYDLEGKKLERLTKDAFADLQPAWSPDGETIAFVTDRFSTKLDDLKYGNYRLASIDARTKEISALPSFPEAKNINPQWGQGAKELYFLSDRGGVTNVYRADLGSQDVFAVTDLVTGATGITALSPSLTVAGPARRLAFSNYEEEGYWIYSIDEPQKLAGTRVDLAPIPAPAAVLPPAERTRSIMAELVEKPDFGLPEGQAFKRLPYRPTLALDYVAQPTFGVGTDRFGTFVGGGTSLFFSDMLGNHIVQASVQASGELKDFVGEFSGAVAYQNRTRRLNWALVLEQVPLRTGSFASGVADVGGGQVALADESIIFRETHRVAAGILSYPLSRAKRVEVSGGFRNIGFHTEQIIDYYDPFSGNFLDERKTTIPSPSGLNLFEGAMAFVHDTSFFGATSPIIGSRYRLEVTPTAGTLNYTGLLADYRAYVMPVRPFTFAVRAMHYGRYGGGGEDPRFTPLFLGYSNLVRGYDVGSFDARECGSAANGSCPVFDQLEGSKMVVGNAEVRFPLLGLFGGNSFYGPFPIEMAFFTDTGVAWTSNQKASFLGGDRDFVTSVGTALRVNVLGFLIAEVDYVHPLDRPRANKSWQWQFNFSPGF
jgi:hypothetical protein